MSDPVRPSPPELDTPDELRSLERYYVVGLICMLFLILAFPLYRWGEPDRRERARAALHEENVRLGASLFAQHCAACHGEGGTGVATGAALGSHDYLSGVTDAQLTWLIAGGVPGTTMAAYHMDLGGPFAPHEVGWIVTWLRSLEAPEVPETRVGAEGPEVEAPGVPSAEDPTAATTFGGISVVAIREGYTRYCAVCHGTEGEGRPPLGPAVRPLAPHLQMDPDSAFTLIARGVPRSTMTGYLDERGGPLDEALIRAMVAWFLDGEP